jgi:FdhD protein
VTLPVKRVDVIRVRDGIRCEDVDCAAMEEPLEVRLHGRPFAVIMRTPGADRELAAGFLFSERVITHADDLGTIEHCQEGSMPEVGLHPDHPAMRVEPEAAAERGAASGGVPGGAAANVVNVTLVDRCRGAVERALDDRRRVATNSSCGLCGRSTIESLAIDVPTMQEGARVSATVVRDLPARLRTAQHAFTATGGLHAAGLFTVEGRLVESAEDVGRHNAVDKVVGRMLMVDRLPLADCILTVSGRTSYEIVQKAALAGIPVVASVSAPSTLAIELAREVGMTLVGFVRGTAFNVYARGDRVIGA